MSTPTPLIAPPTRRRPLILIIVLAIVVAVAIVIAVVVSGRNSSSPSDAAAGSDTITSGLGSSADPVKIGVVGASDPYWDIYKKAAADAGISVDIVDFTGYELPNPSLTEGDLDLNQFQHIIYLAQYNETARANLAPIGSTAIYPLSLYSTQYSSVEDIPAGATVAVPNDASNLARALLVLQSGGLVELKDGGSPYSTLDDVLPASKVKITTLEAALTPTSLPDVAGAIINNDYVTDAGLTADDALLSDDATDDSAKPYINVFAARDEDKTNPVLLKLVTIFQDSKAVTDGLVETSGGSAVLTKTPAADLEASLATVQADYAASK